MVYILLTRASDLMASDIYRLGSIIISQGLAQQGEAVNIFTMIPFTTLSYLYHQDANYAGRPMSLRCFFTFSQPKMSQKYKAFYLRLSFNLFFTVLMPFLLKILHIDYKLLCDLVTMANNS